MNKLNPFYRKEESLVIPKKDIFRYMRSMLQKDEDIDEDVSHRIKVGWLKW
jgi:hypothetical protein